MGATRFEIMRLRPASRRAPHHQFEIRKSPNKGAGEDGLLNRSNTHPGATTTSALIMF